MIKLRDGSGVSATFVCCAALLTSALCVSAQESKSETKTADDGQGGKITTTYATHEGKNYVETVHTNGKGKLLEKRTEISGPDGTVVEIEDYDFTGSEQLTSKLKAETDRSGKVTMMQSETYKDGLLVKGEIAVLKNGDKHRTVIKKWSILQDKYVDVPLEEQGKERQMWKKFDEDLEKHRLERETFFRLLKSGKVSNDSFGTGETIGPVANIVFKNLTNEALNFSIPPAVLESKSGGYQDYVCPKGQAVALGPNETTTVSMNGTCLERDRPPEPNGQPGDLVLNDGDPNHANFNTHMQPEIVERILEIVEPKYEAVDKLEGEDAFKDFPYHERQEREKIAIQWSTWEDPRISDLVHSPPVDKEDFKKTIDEQAKKNHGPITRDVRKKLDKGADSMWDGIELTGDRAKDLEQPSQPPGTFNVSDETTDQETSPAPKTEEKYQKLKEEKEKRKEAKKKWDDWKKKEKLFYVALANKALVQLKYKSALKAYFDKSEKYREAKAKREEESKKGNLLQNPGLADAAVKLTNVEVDLEKEFQKTPDGKKLQKEVDNATKALEKADADKEEAKTKAGVLPAPKLVPLEKGQPPP